MMRLFTIDAALWLTLMAGPGQKQALDLEFFALRQETDAAWQILRRLPDVNGQARSPGIVSEPS